MSLLPCWVGLCLAAGPPPEVLALYKLQVGVIRDLLARDRMIRETAAISREEANAFMEEHLRGILLLADAERKMDPSPAGRLVAARIAFVGARDVEGFFQARFARGLNREQLALWATLSRLEAEVELRLAEAALPAGEWPAAPFTAPPAGYSGTVTQVLGGGLVEVEPATGLKWLDRLRLSHPGEAKPYGELVVALIPRAYPFPPPQPGDRVLPGQALVWATTVPAAAVRVGDKVGP